MAICFQNRYFLYTRKSSEGEDRQVASIPAQIEELKKLAKLNNLQIADIFIEEKSAKAPGRPIFAEMLGQKKGSGAKVPEDV